MSKENCASTSVETLPGTMARISLLRPLIDYRCFSNSPQPGPIEIEIVELGSSPQKGVR